MPDLILALDPARLCGFAHSSGHRGTWNLGDPSGRLAIFKEAILSIHRNYGLDVIAYEDAGYGGNNRNTQAMHNELRGVIKLVASELGAKAIAYHPTTIKKYATGSGRAKKPQMMRACEFHFGFTPADDNVADAAFILDMAKNGYVSPAQAERQMAKRIKAQKKKSPRLF